MLVQLYLELGYFAAVNLVAFILMGIDKQRAKKHLWRIPEKALFLAVILGGGIGGTAGMFFFRHKTRNWYFRFFFPQLAVLQAAGLIYLYFI
ncbi:MAG: DUF1294 domain-containing protein [Ruminococcus sp.]